MGPEELAYIEVPVPPASSFHKRENYILAQLSERLIGCSPEWAVPTLARVEHDYYLVAQTVINLIELWCILLVWDSDNIAPVAYESVPKESISFQGMECFISPSLVQTGEAVLRRPSSRTWQWEKEGQIRKIDEATSRFPPDATRNGQMFGVHSLFGKDLDRHKSSSTGISRKSAPLLSR
jgi:hypothetical protein